MKGYRHPKSAFTNPPKRCSSDTELTATAGGVEALRVLKRHLANAVSKALLTDS